MKKILLLILLLPSISFGQKQLINSDIEITKLSEKVYTYTAWAEMGSWGRVGSNGLILIDDGKAFLCDTPVNEQQTKELVSYIETVLDARIESFMPGHWHDDCVGGMEYLNKIGVKTYANRMTNEILRSRSAPTAKIEFSDSLKIEVGSTPIEFYYLGGGHATDNIVVWLPSEQILFGGCMVKDCASNGIGNTADASPLAEWAATIKCVQAKFPNARVVIPGHGVYGGLELLEHTKILLNK